MARRAAESRLRLKIKATLSNRLDSSWMATCDAIDFLSDTILLDGAEAGQANRAMVVKDYQIAPGATKDIYVSDWRDTDIGFGMGRDALGHPLTIEEIVAFGVYFTAGDGLLELYASVPWDDLEWLPRLTVSAGNALRAGGAVYMYLPSEDAYPVVDEQQQRLRFGAVTGFVNFDLFVLGRHDDEQSSSTSSS